mgnify:CR=1 FL=1
MNSLFGLPAHPFIVHAAVVLVPLAAFGVVVIAASSTMRRKYSGLVVLLAAMGAAAGGLASGSGEELLRHVDLTDAAMAHARMGESGAVAGFAVFAAAAVVFGLQWLTKGGHRLGRTTINLVLVLAVVTVTVATVQMARVGHTGAVSVWDGVADKPAHDVPGMEEE